MEHMEFCERMEGLGQAAKDALTVAELLPKIDTESAGTGKWLAMVHAKYPEQWEHAFKNWKACGVMVRPLLFPEARKASDVFQSADLVPMQSGRTWQDRAAENRKHGPFISALRAKGFCHFGHLGASYYHDAARDVNGQRGGQLYTTHARLTDAANEAYGENVRQPYNEWSLATVEAVQWGDGRILLVARADNGFGSRWLALLDAGESLLPMLSEHERGEIEAEQRAKAERETINA